MEDVSPTLILFIASVVVVAGAVGVFSQQIFLLKNNLLAKKSGLDKSIAGDIEVVHTGYRGDRLSAYVENMGSVALEPNSTRMRLNGEWRNLTGIEIVNSDGNNLWDRKEVAELNLSVSLDKGWNRIAVLNNGIWSQSYRFRVD